MSPFFAAVLAGGAVSLIAFIGFGSLLIAKEQLSRIIGTIVAFAAGVLLGGAFLHLLPEAVEEGGPVFEIALGGLLFFFILDSLLWIYHCHAGHTLHDNDQHGSCPPSKPIGTLNLMGDMLHNITDGVIVGSAFLVSIPFGIITTIAVALHEIPQELSDFAILVHSGFKKKSALIWNFVAALTIFVGIIGVFVATEYVDVLTRYTVPFAAGGFIYIAATNLLSEIKEEASVRRRFYQFLLLMLGIFVQVVVKMFVEV